MDTADTFKDPLIIKETATSNGVAEIIDTQFINCLTDRESQQMDVINLNELDEAIKSTHIQISNTCDSSSVNLIIEKTDEPTKTGTILQKDMKKNKPIVDWIKINIADHDLIIDDLMPSFCVDSLSSGAPRSFIGKSALKQIDAHLKSKKSHSSSKLFFRFYDEIFWPLVKASLISATPAGTDDICVEINVVAVDHSQGHDATP